MDNGKNSVEDEKKYRKKVTQGVEKEVDSFDRNEKSKDDQSLQSDDSDRREDESRP